MSVESSTCPSYRNQVNGVAQRSRFDMTMIGVTAFDMATACCRAVVDERSQGPVDRAFVVQRAGVG